MEWGNFSLTHYLTLLGAVVLVIIMYVILRMLKDPYRKYFAFLLSISGICAIIYNLVMWNSPLEYLPLELCSFNAMILPFFVLTKNKVLGNTLVLWMLGALMALVMNNGVANYEVLGEVFCVYYFPHVIEFGLPLVLIFTGDLKLKAKYMFSTLGLTALLYTVAHIANITLNDYFIKNNVLDYAGNLIQVNYMYSVSTSGIPILNMFRELIPYDYWYMYLILPIAVVYLGIIYLINFLVNKNKNTLTYIK